MKRLKSNCNKNDRGKSKRSSSYW